MTPGGSPPSPLKSTPDKYPYLSLWGGPSSPPCLTAALLRTAACHRTDLALIEGERRLTYGELFGWAQTISALLAVHGVGPGDRVAVSAARSAEAIAAMLGVILSDATYVPLDPSYPARRLEYMVADCKPVVLLQQGPGPGIGIPPPPGSSAVPNMPPYEHDPDLPVYIIYTSGSTGWPKGVAVNHRCLDTMVEWQAQHSPRPDLRTAQFAPLNFDVSFQEVLGTLRGSGTLAVMPEELRREPAQLLVWLAEQRIERLFVPYLALQMLAAAARDDPVAELRLAEVNAAGEQLVCTDEIRSLFARLPGCRLVNHYGQSESAMVTSHVLNRDPQSWPMFPPIGVPLPGCEILIDPPDPSSPTIGEMLVAGDPPADGYLNQPELTRQRFITIPPSPAGHTRAFRTGDLVELTDGKVRFLTRVDDQIKLRGIRVDLLEVDAQLLADPAIIAAACAIVTSQSGAHSLRAAVVYREGATPSPKAVLDRLRKNLPEVSVPLSLTAVSELPRAPSGKIDRDAVAALISMKLSAERQQARRPDQ
jgi:D-alanine--poly(phosphoribitol) ligase subunit 1